jgi:hypothetical protein
MPTSSFYAEIAKRRDDSQELQDCVTRTVDKLIAENTSTNRPGILLGKIQSGKTRAFLGVIALAFEKRYDVAIVLTKGTKTLARQTINRVRADFKPYIDADQVQVFDIMNLPGNLTSWELDQKLIFVVKKEADNLKRLLTAFSDTYPALRSRKLLIVDDEADLASVTFRKKDGEITPGVISSKVEELRKLVQSSSYLQVTATPYSLYLQPEDEVKKNGTALFQPKRPAFTETLPKHSAYVGGAYYFEESSDPASPAYFVYKEVPLAERDALKKEDRRRLRIEDVLTDRNVQVLREALITFVTGAAIRRLQQSAAGQPMKKYALLVHTEQSKESHAWQERVTVAIRDALVDAAKREPTVLEPLLKTAYDDLKRSIAAGGLPLPTFEDAAKAAREALPQGHLMITKVNSDKQVEELLDDNGQLKLRTPMNVFIGGQILDRGLTIENMIGFYYGRNPKKFQQDTVLQHARMYGARPKDDLTVTRFYAPLHIHEVMGKIHEFDTALREAFLSGAHDRGVYFIQRDIADRLVPCSPNKLMFSKLTSVRPGKRILAFGFETVAKTAGRKNLELLDKKVETLLGGKIEGSAMIPLDTAVKLLELAYANLDVDEDEQKAHIAVLEHLSKSSADLHKRGNVYLIAAADRDIVRIRPEGRFSDAPDTKQQQLEARDMAKTIPALMLLRENGSEDKGWKGLPFWWPVIVVPQDAVTSVFAAEAPAEDVGIGRSATV